MKQTNKFNDLLCRNAGRGLINVMLKVISIVYHRLSSCTIVQVVMFCKKMYKIRKTRGKKGLTLYLKACQVILQQSIGGYRVSDLKDLKARPKRNRYGSPLIIHRSVRYMIHVVRNKQIITMWMTLFGIYRVIDFKGSLKLETITKPFKLSTKFITEWNEFINKDFAPLLIRDVKPSPIKLRPIQTSSPTSRIEKDINPTAGKTVISTHFSSL